MTANFSDAYAKAGVNTAEGARAVDLIKPLVESTHIPGVINSIGGFGGMFDPHPYIKDMKRPFFFSSTDGVGTKMEIARQMQKWDTIGIDLVAMCANDIVCSGARPIKFLDYIACGKNEPEVIYQIIKGVTDGCKQADIALIGGEIAEHPGTMEPGSYDIAGFIVGVVDESKVLDRDNVQPGDLLIGIASDGIHSNGFSLVRKIFGDKYGDANNWLNLTPDNTAYHFGRWLLSPTRIYVKSILHVKPLVKSVAHITGGGLYENLPRMLPDHLAAHIHLSSWPRDKYHSMQHNKVFEFISKEGHVSEYDMFNTFNMGVGMVVAVSPDYPSQTLRLLSDKYESASVIGVVIERSGDEQVLFDREISRDDTFSAEAL
jgi:phosphoribosylformylglycinamidine cyclo-ligase